MSRRPHPKWPYPIEVLVLAGLVAIVVTWQGPRAELYQHDVAWHLGLLQFVAFAITLLVGGRAMFDRDEHFLVWQWFVLFGATSIAVLPIFGAQGLAYITDNARWLALGWLPVPLTAMAMALPQYEGRAVRTPRQRARILAPLVVASVIAALVTALWPEPSGPRPNPFAPAERY